MEIVIVLVVLFLLFRVDSKLLNESNNSFFSLIKNQISNNSFVDTHDPILNCAALTIFDREYAQAIQLLTCFNFQEILLWFVLIILKSIS